MKKQIYNIGLVLLGSFLVAFGVNTVFVPFSIASGGVTGLGILINVVTGLNINMVVLVLNIIMLILALIFLGFDFFIKSVVGSLAFPAFMFIIPEIPIADDLFLALVIGNVIVAIGVRVVYMGNGSTGGTTVPPMILNKYFKVSVSKGLLISDGVVVALSLFVLGYQDFVVACVSIAVFIIVFDYISVGLTRSKAVYIISEEHDKIRKEILETLDRGATYIHGAGAYNLVQKDILMVVVSTKQLIVLKKICEKIDPKAFIIINTVNEVHGEGFSYVR